MKPTIDELRKYLTDNNTRIVAASSVNVFLAGGGHITWNDLEDAVASHIEQRADTIGQNGNDGSHYKVGLCD